MLYRIAIFLVIIKSGSCVRPVHGDHVYQSARLIDNNSALLMSASRLIRMWASLVQLPSCYYEATLASLYPVLSSFFLAPFPCAMFLIFSSCCSLCDLSFEIYHVVYFRSTIWYFYVAVYKPESWFLRFDLNKTFLRKHLKIIRGWSSVNPHRNPH